MPHGKKRVFASGGVKKSYVCGKCDKSFPSQRFCDKHIQILHNSESLREVEDVKTCNICFKDFSKNSKLFNHIRLEHNML